MSAPTASAVSRYLNSEFWRSKSCGQVRTTGFTVRAGLGLPGQERDYVVVEYEPGTPNALKDETRLLREAQRTLRMYERFLKDRYDVSRNDEDGPDEWNCLLVRARKGSA